MVLPLCYAGPSYEKHNLPIELETLNAHLTITEGSLGQAKEWLKGLKLVGVMPGNGGLAVTCIGWLRFQ